MYLLDSNILVSAKNHYYDFSICPGFWNWIQRESKAGKVASIQRVKEEINEGDDDDALKLWINDSSPLTFFQPDADTILAMQSVTDWVLSQAYDEKHVASFLAKADPLLIAYAQAHGYKVVTHESLVGPNSKKVKIPNVCDAMDVEFLNTFEMLLSEGAVFDLTS